MITRKNLKVFIAVVLSAVVILVMNLASIYSENLSLGSVLKPSPSTTIMNRSIIYEIKWIAEDKEYKWVYLAE